MSSHRNWTSTSFLTLEQQGRFASHYKKELYAPAVPLLDLLKSTLLLVLSTLVGLIFYYLGLSEANIITVYILGVMLTSIFTKSAVCSF